MDDYDYDSEYADFGTADFDSLGNTDNYSGWGDGNYEEPFQTPQTNNNGGYNFDSEYANFGNQNFDDLGSTMPFDPNSQYQLGQDGSQYWKDTMGKDIGYQLPGGQFTPYDYSGQQGQAQSNPYLDMLNNAMKAGGGALQQLFAPNAKNPNTGNGMMDGIMRLIQGGAGLGKIGLGAYSANEEREKARKFYEYAQQMQQQSMPALDPAASLRPIAAQAWKDINPTMQTLQTGGITANMQQELNASRLAAMRNGGKAGQRFAQYASRQDPYLMAQARKNDFGMQLSALKQRYDEATKGPHAGYTDMMKLPAQAYQQTLTDPMTQWASKSLQDLTGGGRSIDGEVLDQLRTFLSKQG